MNPDNQAEVEGLFFSCSGLLGYFASITCLLSETSGKKTTTHVFTHLDLTFYNVLTIIAFRYLQRVHDLKEQYLTTAHPEMSAATQIVR